MKILSIQIEKVRGLVGFSFEPKGKSVVVSGPNGSGKSALVDAIDFLFTGTIARLEGKGTGNVSLKDHGPHVDHKPVNAIVRAEVVLSSGKKYKIERKISDPKNLKCDPAPDVEMTEALGISEHGYHVLTRREILRYIAAEPSTRAQEVQTLLNVSEIEGLRKLINATGKDFEKESAMRVRDIDVHRKDIAALLGFGTFSDAAVLSSVNAQRVILRAAEIPASALPMPKDGVQVPSSAPDVASDPVLVADDIKKIEFSDPTKKALESSEEKIRSLFAEVAKDPELKKDLDYKELIDMGLELIGSGEKCPLCERAWAAVELKKFLEERQKKAVKASELQGLAKTQADGIVLLVGTYRTVLPRLSAAAEKLGLKESKILFDDLIKKLTLWFERLNNPLSDYPAGVESIAGDFLNNATFSSHLALLDAAAKKSVPAISPEQKAWDTLTKFEVQWGRLQKLTSEHAVIETRKSQCAELVLQFEKARDTIMGGLYSEIEASFIKLYTVLHDHEKPTFGASLRPDGAGLKFEVDFHGRGKYPPIAMHSEGHQDSMGLCLYLALMGKLTEGKIGLTILDDVVMSVDSGHRQPVCKLLSTQFADRQFFITTHDKIWARQLRNAGVVPPENFLAFREWTVEDGPKWREDDHWREIEEHLKKGEVAKAAAALRRELEEFFDDCCDLLVALVPYSGDARYELSDTMDSALIKLGRLFADAKKAANSWNQQDRLKEIKEWDDRFTAAKGESKAESWIVNPTVHFTRLLQADPKDFAPVLAGFSKLREAFMCPTCRSLLYVLPRKPHHTVRCRCGAINWNLLEKTKDDEKRQAAVVVEAR